MARRRPHRTTQIIAYVLSGIVALTMVLSLVGPILFSTSAPPTPTWPPTWTPWPTSTPTTALTSTPTTAPTVVGPPPPPTSSATATPSVAAEPVAGPPTPLTFAVVGDHQEVYPDLLDRVMEDGNAFLIHTGDLVDDGSREQFQTFRERMAGFALPFYPVPGERDVGQDGTLANYVALSGAPAERYSFDVEAVHFVMVNSATGSLGEQDLAWLDADLVATDRPVKIIVTHYPPFDPNGSADILLSGSEAFVELVKEHGVAYVLAGHIDAYSEQERDGTVYVITGGAGDPNASYHYVQVTVVGTQVSTSVVRLE